MFVLLSKLNKTLGLVVRVLTAYNHKGFKFHLNMYFLIFPMYTYSYQAVCDTLGQRIDCNRDDYLYINKMKGSVCSFKIAVFLQVHIVI